MFSFIHQYAYFFSLIFYILPISLVFDAMTGLAVMRKMLTLKGLCYLLLSVLFWSVYDIFWIRQLGYFPSNRILATVGGIPIEEMLLFTLGFYNVAAIFTWSRRTFP